MHMRIVEAVVQQPVRMVVGDKAAINDVSVHCVTGALYLHPLFDLR